MDQAKQKSSTGSTNHTKEYFAEYCNNTSLHGLKYVGGEKRTILEKLVWGLLFILSLSFSIIIILKAFEKWKASPVIVSFSEKQSSVWEIPFPAVTICPQIKVKRSIYNYTEKVFHQHEGKYDHLKYLYVCDALPEIVKLITKVSRFSETIDAEANETDAQFLIDDLIKVGPSLEEIVIFCMWNSKPVLCTSLFTTILTEDGLCYTFNMLGPEKIYSENNMIHEYFKGTRQYESDWDLEKGYERKDFSSYPNKIFGAGIKTGLEVMLVSSKVDFDNFCSSSILGYKVIMHSPSDIPKGRTQYVRAPTDQEVVISLTPKYIKTQEELREYSIDDRECFFQNERKLKYFKSYTQENCNLECVANYTFKLCGCAVFHMPRDNGTKLCSWKKYDCAQSVEAEMLKLSAEESKTDDIVIPCDCKQSCYSLEYKTETSKAPLDWRPFFKNLDLYVEITENITSEETENQIYRDSHVTSIKIFFDDVHFLSIERNELNGITDFLANCGGLLGLFTGFSVLSLIEIIYYLTLRAIINKMRHGRFYKPHTDDDNLNKCI